jgi:hypothetical protein
VFEEYLDQPTFYGQDYEQVVERYLREKYAPYPPAVVVGVGQFALAFLVRHRAGMFPGVPVVHAAVEKPMLDSLAPLPADELGIEAGYDLAGTVQLALRLHPNTRHFVVVKRVRNLGSGDIVYTPGYYKDGAGRIFLPFETVKAISAESAAPVHTAYTSLIGTGVVGGSMADFTNMGRQAGGVVSALLDGTPLSQLPLPAKERAQPVVDWRQVNKWGISADAVPGNAVIHCRRRVAARHRGDGHHQREVQRGAAWLAASLPPTSTSKPKTSSQAEKARTRLVLAAARDVQKALG